MEDFELEIKKEFISEAIMNLEETESSFMELESASEPKPLLDKIFRLAHNLKGGSRAVGFGDVAEFTHKLENLVLKIQQGQVGLNPHLVTTLLKCNDRLIEMLSALKEDLSATFNNQDLLADIENWIEGKASESSQESSTSNSPGTQKKSDFVPPEVPSSSAFFPENEIAAIPEASALPTEAVAIAALEDAAQILTPPNPQQSSKALEEAPKVVEQTSSSSIPPASGGGNKEKSLSSKEDEVVRVSISRINQLNDYVGELIVLQSVVAQQAATGDSQKVQHSMRMMGKISKEIQNLAMSLRMLPVKPLVQKLQRVVRDTARALNKDVDLELVGEQLDIDKSVLDQLADPLIHILRNAVDHGLESTDERIQSKKNPKGKVLLSFFNEGNHLIVEVKDDGKGIDHTVIRKKALQKKIISESQGLTEKQIINLIFHAGFSTKDVTSEISGRGVGMDVVKTNVEKIGGQVEVSTRVGQGSIFRLQIPLSLAVIDGMVVSTIANRYVLPLNQIQETVNLKAQKVFEGKLGIGSCFELRGTVVPIIQLEDAVGNKKTGIDPGDTALIINVRDQLIALCVNDIQRTQQIVIKPLGNGIESRKGFVGTCVLGDGLPTLILSAVDLLQGRYSQGLNTSRENAKAA